MIGKPSDLYDSSNPDWAPTLNLGHDESALLGGNPDSRKSRYERAQARQRRRTVVLNEDNDNRM